MSNTDSVKAIFKDFEASLQNVRLRSADLERNLQPQLPLSSTGGGPERRNLVAIEKAFLATYDDYDAAQVEMDLDDANYLVEQLATNISISHDSALTQTSSQPLEYPESLHRYISPMFINSMASAKPQDKQSFVEYAARAAILQQVSELLGQFCCGVPEGRDKTFRDLAELTRIREIQPIYGKWRSVLHKTTRQRYNIGTNNRNPDTVLQNEAWIQNQMGVAANNIYSCLTLIYNSNPPPDHFPLWFEANKGPLRDIFEVASKMAHRLKEDVVTKDYIPDPEFSFDSQPAAPEKSHFKVCVKLGLRYKYKQGRLGGKVSDIEWKQPHFVTINLAEGTISLPYERYEFSIDFDYSGG